ncbi:MAG: hypothetical protein ACKVHE_24855 [Planctomycetales bacterium]|jgi:hypothetical protein
MKRSHVREIQLHRIVLNVLVPTLLIAVSGSWIEADDTPGSTLNPAELFNARIMPIFRSSDPSSCVQCHLSSVDLKNYILPSHEKTFLSLRDQGLIDLEAPARSKILTLIRMGDKDQDGKARRIHEKTRLAEYEAFATWVDACCKDPKLRTQPPLTKAERAAPASSNAVIRHARKSRVVDSFARNVWSQRMRYFPCHTPHEIDPSNGRHQVAIKNMKKFKELYPAELIERLKIFKESPEATLESLVTRSRNTPKGQTPLLNLADPANSLLLLKPMSKVPPKNADGSFDLPSPNDRPMTHMGGLKLHKNDQSYKSIISWMTDYAAVVNGQYKSVDELPADNWHGSKLGLRMIEAPADWKVGTPVQLYVHQWNEASKSWADQAVAFTQGTVTPRHMVNGSLFLLKTKQSSGNDKHNAKNATLPRGRYQVRAYVDSDGLLAADPTLMLSEKHFVGQAEIKSARWREGFRQAESVTGAAFAALK